MSVRTLTPLAALVTAALLAPPADAKVTATRSAKKIAQAIVTHRSQLAGARWVKLPPRGNPAAISTTPLVSFPRAGNSFGVLSSGDAALIDTPNDSDATSNDNGGLTYRGTRDTVTLRVDVNVPRGAKCLSFQFRFLSEEFPEFVGSDYNDAFLAELDRNDWSGHGGSPKISAPHNFAFARHKHLISVNGTGDFAVTKARAGGTTYDAGTRRLRASHPVTPGRHSVYFTIFDQGDRDYDSSVVIDGLNANHRTPCTSGASLD